MWTRPEVLPETLRKNSLKERDFAMRTVPTLLGCQQVTRAVAALHDAHNGFLTGVFDAFQQANLAIYALSALFEVGRFTGYSYALTLILPTNFRKDRLADYEIWGDPLPVRLPDADTSKKETLHNVIYPDFKTRFHRYGAKRRNILFCNAIRIGDRPKKNRYGGPLIMTLMPQTPKPFQDFFRILARRDERIPYRISYLIEHGGLNMGLKPILSTLLSVTSSSNKRFNNAVDALRKLDLEGVCCTKFRICFCTWASLRDLPTEKGLLLLKRRMAELSKTVQGWGTTDISEAVGDPLLGLTATIPALMPTSPAPITAAPLQDAIGMLPMRSASPWREGSLLLRTQDGKIIPFAPNSSEQATTQTGD